VGSGRTVDGATQGGKRAQALSTAPSGGRWNVSVAGAGGVLGQGGGRIALAPQAAYAASKWALEAMSDCLAQEMRAFNVRVALVEPGVIATPIFGKGRPPIKNSPYPHTRRMAALFAASLTNATSPFVVADQIVEIVSGDSGRLRYPVGFGAAPFLAWRAGKPDEAFIALGAAADAEFAAVVKADLGLDVTL
jgi:NAD(P)-dependent dehydrogenase (short-subunit alcohol dehydrogenase family)